MVGGSAVGDEVGKVMFLVNEDERFTAVNAETGQFFELDIVNHETVITGGKLSCLHIFFKSSESCSNIL